MSKSAQPTTVYISTIIQICSEITRGRVLNGALYTQRVQTNATKMQIQNANQLTSIICVHIQNCTIQIYSEITRGRVLNGELYTPR